MLIARIDEVFPWWRIKIFAFLTEADPLQRILIHIGEPATKPRIATARTPPDWREADIDQTYLN